MEKIKIIILLLITILTPLIFDYQANAQITFERLLGGAGDDESFSIQHTSDGGYIIVGSSLGAGFTDVYLIKIDANYDISWTKTYGGSGYDVGYSVQQTSDGGYIVTGGINLFGGIYLIKTNTTGDTLWTKTYGGANLESGRSVQQTFDGGYIIAGTTASFGAGDFDVYLIKTDSNGDTLWTKTFGGINDDYASSIQQTADSGYIVLGATIVSLQWNYYLIKTDVGGNIEWTKRYGGNNSDRGSSVKQTPDNGYIIVGTSPSLGMANLALIKTNANGDILWAKAYGTLNSNDYGTSVQLTSDGGYIAAGYSFFTNDSVYIYSVKTDANGDTLWTKMYGEGIDSSTSEPPSVKQTSDGGFIFAGSTNLLGNSDIYLIKTDTNGNSGCSDFNTNTIVSNISFTISSGAITGSGTVVSNTATIVSNPATYDSVLCSNCYINPIVAFGYTDSFLTVTFYDSMFNSTNWNWDFGDGDTSMLQNPVHTYDSAGIYYVCLTATSICDTVIICDSINVTCSKPISLFGYTDSLLSVSFSDSSIGATSLLWYFGDGDSTTLQNPVHVYDSAATYYVCLITINSCGSDTICDTVTLFCPKPIPLFGFTDTLLTVYFYDTSFNSTSWLWNFGDGDTTTLQNPTHTYDSAGIYNVCLTATSICDTVTICDFITVSCPKPISLFGYTDSLLTVSFSDSSTGATSWLWDFDDGDTDTIQNPTHIYQNPGTYTVILIAGNVCGSDTIMRSVTVNVLGISEWVLNNFKLYPNPNNGNFQINYQLPVKQDGVFVIYDIMGRKVKIRQLVGGKNKLYITDIELNNGLYFYQVIVNDKVIIKDKLLIIK